MFRRSIAAPRGESAVPTLLTLVVSAWFFAAGVAIFADRVDAAPPTVSPVASQGCSAVLAAAPEVRETILVQARRG